MLHPGEIPVAGGLITFVGLGTQDKWEMEPA